VSDYSKIAERFAKETAAHEMTVLHDDGLYRHLRFKDPNYFGYWFDLITVPGVLIFRGDGASYVFARITDMFEFFRAGARDDGLIHINPHYWAEKLTSDSDSVMKYDQDLFERQVKEYVAEAIKEGTAPRGISRAVRDLLENGDITHEDGARRELEEFRYGDTVKVSCTCGAEDEFAEPSVAESWRRRHITPENAQAQHRVKRERVEGFRFYDVWEWDFKDFDWRFLWACHAIVWGIQQYDALKAAQKAEVAS
jgi:hypothetical protein